MIIIPPAFMPTGNIVFAFPFVRSLVHSFVSSVEFASKVLVKVSLVVYISCSYSQKPFIFGP